MLESTPTIGLLSVEESILLESTHYVLQLLDETSAVTLNEITIKRSHYTMFDLHDRSENSKIIPTSYSENV